MKKSASFNPYCILGLKPAAGKEAVRAAFKKLAKKHHPDIVGRENEIFNWIKAAYDLLMDDKARELYDTLGVIPGDDASHNRMKAIQGLLHMFGQVLAQADNLESTDIFGVMESHIKEALSRQKKEIESLNGTTAKFKKALAILQKRMKCSGKKNIFIDSLEKNIAAIPGMIAMQEKESAVFREMLVVLKDYDFDFNQPLGAYTPTTTAPRNFFTVRLG